MDTLLDNPLRNHWFALRHGQSVANVEEIVVSDPANGCDRYGLTDTGRHQFHDSLSARGLARFGSGAPDRHALLYSSDFARAIQSAQVAAELLQIDAPIQIDTQLRERHFGRHELQHAQIYEDVWRADRIDAERADNGVEPVSSVAARMTAAVQSIEAQHSGRTIVLVSHGDPLQILQCVFNQRPLVQHRELDPLLNAELRLLGRRTGDD